MTIKGIKKSLVVGLAVFGFVCGGQAFATTYSHDVEVNFNFNSQISVSFYDLGVGADIIIEQLVPGTSSDSNIVGIGVSTNSIAGYNLSATVGSADNATTNMTHGTDVFTSIATDASQASLTTDNTWGYSTSTDNGTTWTNFSGLPLYTATAKELANTNSPTGDIIKFKINAKASTSQPSGNYTNIINFIAVANTPPRDFEDVINPETPRDPVTNLPTIQSIDGGICELVEVYDTQFQVTDSRDHKNYWISKLRDDHCWMTQNLDYDITSNVALTNETTDLGWNGTGYSTTSWIPNKTTYKQADGSGDTPSADPLGVYSFDPGDYYEQGTYFSSSNCDYLSSGSSCTTITATEDTAHNGTHGHIGNYYSWNAAAATNDSSSITSEVTNSICPTNWRLPSVGSNNDFATINNLYNNGSSSTDSGLFADPVYFVRSGFTQAAPMVANAGNSMNYWSNEARSMPFAYFLSATSSSVDTKVSTNNFPRFFGYSVRCIVRDVAYLNISFNSNGGTGTMQGQRIAVGASANLSSNTFTKSGDTFIGWNTASDGNGEDFKDEDLYEVSPNETRSNITLYAMWESDGKTANRVMDDDNVPPCVVDANGCHDKQPSEDTTGKEVYYPMQAMTTSVCSRITKVGAQTKLIDKRDGKKYYIAKLADGHCWMTQNLDLDLSTTKTLTSADTDLNDSSLSGVYNSGYTYNSTSGVISYTPSQNTWVWTNNAWSGSGETKGDAPVVYDVGDYYQNGEYFDSNSCNYLTTNCAIRVNNVTIPNSSMYSKTPFITSNGTHGHVGNYYSIVAAVASNTLATDSSDNYYQGTDSFKNSICPKGWRLPFANATVQNDERYQLISAYNNVQPNTGVTATSVSYNKPIYLIRNGSISGYYSGSPSLSSAGHNGYYFSNTIQTTFGTYYSLSVYESGDSGTLNTYVDFSYTYGKDLATSLRCVAK